MVSSDPEVVDWRVKDTVVPPGGWGYDQELTGGRGIHRIESPDYAHLLQSVFDWRLAHLELIPAGRSPLRYVEEDIKFQLCTRYPDQCNPIRRATAIALRNPREAPAQTRAIQPLLSRMEQWLISKSVRQISPIDPVRARERARICITCPQNVSWQTPCGPCNSNLVRRSLLLRGDLYLPEDRQLKGCRVFGHLNEVAVWLIDPGGNPIHEPPNFCWHQKPETSDPGAQSAAVDPCAQTQ